MVFIKSAGLRTQASTSNGLTWFLNDQLGSTTVILDTNGLMIVKIRFDAWGKSRYTYVTTPTAHHITPDNTNRGCSDQYIRVLFIFYDFFQCSESLQMMKGIKSQNIGMKPAADGVQCVQNL